MSQALSQAQGCTAVVVVVVADVMDFVWGRDRLFHVIWRYLARSGLLSVD